MMPLAHLVAHSRERESRLAAASPPPLRSLTTALSATLIELAAAADVVEPVHRLLSVEADGERSWLSALGRLLRTGKAYAVAAGAAALLCAT
jgi:hypothetical protein